MYIYIYIYTHAHTRVRIIPNVLSLAQILDLLHTTHLCIGLTNS